MSKPSNRGRGAAALWEQTGSKGGVPLIAELPPTAQRVLAAARRVLARDGFSGLTLEAVATESGENKSAVWYYFSGKRGLIMALADSVEQNDTARLLDHDSAADPAADPLDRFMAIQRGGIGRDDYRIFYDLLPHMLRDQEMHGRLARLMEWYLEVDRQALAPVGVDPDDPVLLQLAMLTTAVADGLGVQFSVNPDMDLDGALDLWRRLIGAVLAEVAGIGGPPTSD